MENITTTAGLKNAILLLEYKQVENGQHLEEDFYTVVEILKPANLIRTTLSNITTSPGLVNALLGGALGIATGYLSKKIVVGASGSILKKLLGTVLQFGVTTVVAQHPETVRSISQFILKHILRKKTQNPML